MDKIKKLNLKKQIFSLKYCYEDLLLETKASISKVHDLENIFKITKQYIKEKKKDNFDFKKEKRYLLIINKKDSIYKNLIQQNKTLLKSILFSKYQELQNQKELLIQTIKEKTSVLNLLKHELNVYKIFRPFGNQVTQIYLHNNLDSLLTNGNNKNNSIVIDKNLKNYMSLVNKENINLQNKCEENCNKMRAIYNKSIKIYENMIKERGYNSCIFNRKYNKTYFFTVEPVKGGNNASSNDSESESNDNDNISNTINEHIFDDEKENNNINKIHLNKSFVETNKKNLNIKNKYQNDLTFLGNNKKSILKKSIDNNKNNKGNKMNISYINHRDKFEFLTEINYERNDELNKKLYKLKERYYECLDQRYELKNVLKENITKIYYVKEKIKKYKKDKNIAIK